MTASRPTVVITGASGNLGSRLLPLLGNYNIVALDMRPPADHDGLPPFEFEQFDLGIEDSCDRLIAILRETRAEAVVHLAFIIDPQRNGVLDKRRMWQINVAGTARVLEAITEVNRLDGSVRRLIVPSSVSAYGPDLSRPVNEDSPLGAHTLTYAVHKKEADEIVQRRAAYLGDCTTYLLRPHIFVGRTMQNYLVGALRGTPTGSGRLGAWLREKGRRLPMLLPMGKGQLEKQFQFVHVDDVARLIEFLLRQPRLDGLQIFNVAARGESVSIARAAEVANAKIVSLPGKPACRLTLKALWELGICAVPPDALPYMCGSYTMNTRKLQELLGDQYSQIIRYTIEEGLADSFADSPTPVANSTTASR
jgi:nucleoside-diphosphate-sugar epimerase